MPPPVATLVTLCLCVYMLRREERLHSNASSALWLPVIWLFIICSRLPGQWLVVLGFPAGIFGPSSEGTPIDAAIFLTLTLSGLRVLSRRGFCLADFVRDNRCLTIFLVYCLLSVLWSDTPFVSLKRWIKILGHPVMALVILTDPDPLQALRLSFRKAAILLLPLSILFIKYYPGLGRSYDEWTGIPFYSGVTTMKNSLGSICLIYALFFCWDVLMVWRASDLKGRRTQLMVSAGFLFLALYILDLAQSATSLACLVLGAARILALGTCFVNPRYMGPTLIAVLILAAIGEMGFNLRENIIHMLGRNTTLTERTDLWAAVISVQNNVILGSGFENFWSGERSALLAAMGFPFNQAHNGYIDTYLNLGAVGLLLLLAWIFVSYQKICADLMNHFDLGRFELAFLFAILAYNYTEAAFKATHPIWTMLFLVSIRCDAYRWRTFSRDRSSDGEPMEVFPPEPVPVGPAYVNAR